MITSPCRAKPKIPIAGLKLTAKLRRIAIAGRAKPKIPIAGLKHGASSVKIIAYERAKPKIPIAGLKLLTLALSYFCLAARKTQNPDRGTETGLCRQMGQQPIHAQNPKSRSRD